MVGFPGETDRDFNDTVNLIKKIAPDFAYVFKYSTREKTTASKYKDNISKEIKEKRHKILLDLCNKIAERKNRTFGNPGYYEELRYEQNCDTYERIGVRQVS